MFCEMLFYILVGFFLIPGILKTFLLGQPRRKVVIKSLFVSADHFLVPAANFFVPAANFFQQQLQQQKVARTSVKLIFAGS